jgi:hypothetical protein
MLDYTKMGKDVLMDIADRNGIDVSREHYGTIGEHKWGTTSDRAGCFVSFDGNPLSHDLRDVMLTEAAILLINHGDSVEEEAEKECS